MSDILRALEFTKNRTHTQKKKNVFKNYIIRVIAEIIIIHFEYLVSSSHLVSLTKIEEINVV